MTTAKKYGKLDCDVVVAGAGPAGSATATYLARAGISVVLVDRQTFPRDKICGDFVGPVTLLELWSLGIADQIPEFRDSNVIHRAALYLNGQNLITHAIPRIGNLPNYGRVIPRKTLDNILLCAARKSGACVIEGADVLSYKTSPDGVSVNMKDKNGLRTLTCGVLVGADGGGSRIARQLRGQGVSGGSHLIAMRGYFEGVSGPSDRCDIFFSDNSFPGYYWLFPTGGATANVGIGMVMDSLPPVKDHLKDLLLNSIERDAGLHDRLGSARLKGQIKGWPLRTYDPSLPVAADRVLLVGDAAGLINPINGEGVQSAILSGRWAAETLLHCMPRGDYSKTVPEHYAVRVRNELRCDMALPRMITQLIRNRSLIPLWFQALRVIIDRARSDHAYADITGGVLAGLVPAGRVMSPDIMFKTVMQAGLSSVNGAVDSLLRGPVRWCELGAEFGVTAVNAVTTAVGHPVESAIWGTGVLDCSFQLAADIVGDLSIDSARTLSCCSNLLGATAHRHRTGNR
jgi:geranylgeranyl reductase family protein